MKLYVIMSLHETQNKQIQDLCSVSYQGSFPSDLLAFVYCGCKKLQFIMV